jgi:hypothetical protein
MAPAASPAAPATSTAVGLGLAAATPLSLQGSVAQMLAHGLIVALLFACVGLIERKTGTSTIAEGIAVGTPGRITEAIIRERVDDLLLVDEGDIEQAVLMLLEIEKTVVEGAGAAGLAALLKYPERFTGRIELFLSFREPVLQLDVV